MFFHDYVSRLVAGNETNILCRFERNEVQRRISGNMTWTNRLVLGFFPDQSIGGTLNS